MSQAHSGPLLLKLIGILNNGKSPAFDVDGFHSYEGVVPPTSFSSRRTSEVATALSTGCIRLGQQGS